MNRITKKHVGQRLLVNIDGMEYTRNNDMIIQSVQASNFFYVDNDGPFYVVFNAPRREWHVIEVLDDRKLTPEDRKKKG